jgi:hypothetical protein
MELEKLFRALVKMAAIDQKFASEEVGFLVDRARAWGIDQSVFDQAVEEVKAGDVSINIPEAIADREHMIKEMVRMMAVDGVLAETEKRMCAAACAQMELSADHINAILDDLV